MSAIDLGGVRLSEDDRPTWVHAFPLGEYHHPVHGRLVFTHERLERLAAGVNGRSRGIDLAIDYEHRGDVAKGARAAGWITAAEVRADGLWLAVAFTDEARREVRAGAWRYLSPEYQDTWTHPQTGVRHRDVLLGAALTNRPFLRGLAAVAACEPATVAAVWSDPRVLSAGITLADVLAADVLEATSRTVHGDPVDVDPQAAFVALAEQLGSYKVAARQDPAAWAAYRDAADLNGPEVTT
jgi:phage I-like protein